MAEIRWVDRDAEGKIAGHYARMQREGQESLWDDCAEMQEFAAYLKNPEIRLPIEDFVKKQIEILDNRTKDYVYSRYPQHRQTTFTKLQMDAITTSNAAAGAYIQLLWTWMALCFSAYYAAEDQIVAIGQGAGTDDEKKEAIKAVVSSINFDALTAQDPVVTIRHTMGLLHV